MDERGLDGFDSETLRRSRAAFWDDSFTDRLIAALPASPLRWADVGCGLGTAARELLPKLPGSQYVGIDADGARLAEARRALRDDPVADRARFIVGRVEELPLASGSIDAVVAVMTLQHIRNVMAAIHEAKRVLRPGGRLLAAEPDNIGQRFYADGPLDALSDAVRALSVEVRRTRAPADLAIGPRVAGLFLAAGLSDVAVAVHAVHSTRIEEAAQFGRRVWRVIRAIAGLAALQDCAPCVRRCEEEIERAIAPIPLDRPVATSQVVPIFVTVGARP